MDSKVYTQRRRGEGGFSLIEMMIVVGVIAITMGVTIPQVIGARRLIRSAGVTRELVGGLRDARQLAISRRRAVTFQYNDATKQVRIIDHGIDAEGLGKSGKTILSAGNYPDTTGSSVANSFSLTGGGVPATEITYGAPPAAPAAAQTLGDKIKVSTLTSQKITLTFQPDGTIIDTGGVYSSAALALYNSKQPNETATAISILGATGRIKVWRYSKSASKFVE